MKAWSSLCVNPTALLVKSRTPPCVVVRCWVWAKVVLSRSFSCVSWVPTTYVSKSPLSLRKGLFAFIF